MLTIHKIHLCVPKTRKCGTGSFFSSWRWRLGDLWWQRVPGPQFWRFDPGISWQSFNEMGDPTRNMWVGMASTCRGLECTKSVKWYYVYIYISFIFNGGFGGFCTFRMLCAAESCKRPIMWSWGPCLSFDGICFFSVIMCHHVSSLGGQGTIVRWLWI